MNKVDLETQSAASTDNAPKIALETVAGDMETKNNIIPGDDLPPESFWLPKDAECDWLDRSAVYERKESTKGNPNTNNMNPAMNNSNSQRSSVFSKASMIGLPKTLKNTLMDSKWKPYKASNQRLFPKREKSTVPETEPGSPNVSCMGRVRSKRSCHRSDSMRTTDEKLSAGGDGKQKSGFCSRLMSVFRSKKGHKNPVQSGSGEIVIEPPRMSIGLKARPEGGEPAIGPPGLGGMARFVSGRRSCEWAAEEVNQGI